MNLNQLALAITKMEKGKKQVDIAQTKEVLKCLGCILVSFTPDEAVAVFAQLLKSAGRRR